MTSVRVFIQLVYVYLYN